MLIVVSENEEFYRALKITLNTIADIPVVRFTEDGVRNKSNIILLATTEDNMRWLFYEKIRSKYLNPLIALGFKEKKLFENEYPLFYNHPYNHAYLRVPFNLLELVDLFKNMTPISSQPIRKAICGNDLGYRGYLLKLLGHDLLKDRSSCIQILIMVDNYIKNEKLSKEISDTINKIKVEACWPLVATQLSKKLGNIIQENP